MVNPKVFVRQIQIRFGDCDPARILYFPRIFELAHETFEDFVQECGLSWQEWFRRNDYIVPIRHAESDYYRSLEPGKPYFVHTFVQSMTESSFRMQYLFVSQTLDLEEFYSSSRDKYPTLEEFARPFLHAKVQIVHTFADVETRQKVSIPSPIRNRLSPFHFHLTHELQT